MGGYRGPKIIKDGLVLYLDSGNNKSYTPGSSIWGDLSSDLNNAQLYGTSFNYNYGGVISFNGINNFGIIPSSSDWGIGNTGTITAWLYFSGSVVTNHRIWCVTNNPTSLDAYLDMGGGSLGMHGGRVSTSTQLPRDIWVHLAVTYNNGNISIYFNGELQPLIGITSGYTITNQNPLHIGQYSGGGNYKWRGYMGSIIIYKNKCLSQQEILNNYNTVKNRYLYYNSIPQPTDSTIWVDSDYWDDTKNWFE